MEQVAIRMYCLGTGDCFIYKFTGKDNSKFLMMIDCGSCVGDKQAFTPYIEDLADFVKNEGGLDLLVITHEHQDHVNGFHKCREIFAAEDFEIREAWFAWTENEIDPDDRVADLQSKRKKMRMGFDRAMRKLTENQQEIIKNFEGDYAQKKVGASHGALLNGLNTLAEINLDKDLGVAGEPLPGMKAIKEILKAKKTKIKYLNPGEIKALSGAPGLKFYILGPPYSQDSIFKDGKQGKDVYKKYLAINDSVLSADLFNAIPADMSSPIDHKRLPFESRYLVDKNIDAGQDPNVYTSNFFNRDDEGNLQRVEYKTRVRQVVQEYKSTKNSWRKIDHDWLGSAGSLALRLNSHINNTSLAMAIEFEETGDVLLLPGDAEFGSWESWHLIKKWKKKGKNERHLAEDLLSRTRFYKVGHHLSYNGTALEKGISMMPDSGMVSMVTLDRERISSKWKTTMPNKELLQDLIRRCEGKVFIMNEFEINNPPSKTFEKGSLKADEYNETNLYKEYVLKIGRNGK